MSYLGIVGAAAAFCRPVTRGAGDAAIAVSAYATIFADVAALTAVSAVITLRGAPDWMLVVGFFVWVAKCNGALTRLWEAAAYFSPAHGYSLRRQALDPMLRRLAVLAVDPVNPSPSSRGDLEKRIAEDPQDVAAMSRLAALEMRTGAVAKVRDRDVHAEPIPYLGGLAMLGGLSAAYLVARQLEDVPLPPAHEAPFAVLT